MSKPITRKEEYLAAAAGDKVDYPAYPMTREEAYLQRIAQGGGIEANTGETPTGTLESLKIGDEVYAVPSGGGGGGTSDYSALNNKPQINGVTLIGNKTTQDLNISYDDLQNKPTIPSAQIQSDWEQTDTSKADFIKNKPSIPDDLADLNDDSSHRTVTDTEKSTWNGKSDFSGDYNDLQNKPTIPDPQVQADWNQTDNTKPDFIKNKPSVPSGQVQSDWAQTTSSEPDYIKNKPSLGSAASKNVPSTGDAGSGEVVMGNDSRLSDSRPASDVSSWAKQATKPSYTANEVGAIPSTDKGANGGVATLGNDGIVPSSQLPSMFDGDYNSLTNKPTLGTAAAKDVPSAGNASLTEVVMGSDSRLSDDRNAKDVYTWAKSATKPTYTATEVGAIPSTDKGANGGVAELDSNGKVPSSQLPSYVDDVLSYASQSAFPATGETGKIYIAEDTNKTYRWSGSAYAEISASLALGETSSTAYRGDRGKTAYDHSQTTGNPHGTTKSDVGLGNVPNVTTNFQTPTFTEASTRNNIASGEKLSVILGKIQKFFNDLKTVAFSGSYNDLTDKPSLATVATSGSYNDLTDKLTFDNVPTDGSNNPVKSDGVYDSEKDIYAVMGKMGAKNLLPYPYKETTKTLNGITFTDNGDGTITTNGTATSDAIFVLYQSGVSLLKVGRYILSGCPEGGGTNIYKIQAAKNDWTFVGADFGAGAVFEITNESTQQIQYIRILVSSGQTVSNLTFKPMFRLASDTDDTYQPYAKTNKELTDEIATKTKNFQGTIAEWNQLTTAEKKAYDHASITGTGGGEYNVDKSTGDLVQTSGMPSEYPATQVMLSDGVTSVEDALEALNQEIIISITANGVKTYGQYFTELYNAIHNYNGIRKQSLTLQIGVRIFKLSYFDSGEYQFSMFAVGTYVYSRGVVLNASACGYKLAQNTTITNLINDVPASGEIITVYQ